jgi:hypothetical protein
LADLLLVVDFSVLSRKEMVPLLLEFQVNPECAPFLVSSTRSLVWVSQFRNHTIRAAVRRGVPSLGHYFMEVVLSVEAMGEEAQWGNIHPLTRKGIAAAMGHLESYDLSDLELLISEQGFDKDIAKAWQDKGGDTILGVPFQRCSWLSPGYVIAVPKDRDFLGWAGWDAGRLVSVVHNAGRGVAIARRPYKIVP